MHRNSFETGILHIGQDPIGSIRITGPVYFPSFIYLFFFLRDKRRLTALQSDLHFPNLISVCLSRHFIPNLFRIPPYATAWGVS